MVHFSLFLHRSIADQIYRSLLDICRRYLMVFCLLKIAFWYLNIRLLMIPCFPYSLLSNSVNQICFNFFTSRYSFSLVFLCLIQPLISFYHRPYRQRFPLLLHIVDQSWDWIYIFCQNYQIWIFKAFRGVIVSDGSNQGLLL